MKHARWMFVLLLVFFVAAATVVAIGCASGDDDDDDADDDDDDDDDDQENPCGDYDVVIDGQTHLPTHSTSNWTASLAIDDANAITGIVEPDSEEIDPYDVTGQRIDATTGFLQGSFDTPENLADLCQKETVFFDMDFTIVSTVFTGTARYFCGSTDPLDWLADLNATGTVICGDFSQ